MRGGCEGFLFRFGVEWDGYTLGLLEKFVKERMLFGSDFLYAPMKAISGFVEGMEGFGLGRGGEARRVVGLFPRLSGVGGYVRSEGTTWGLVSEFS